MSIRLTMFALVASLALPSLGGVTDADVRKAVKQLTKRILDQQKGTGAWEYPRYPVGATALCLTALLQAEVPKNHPAVKSAARYLTNNSDNMVYSEALAAVALEKLDAKANFDRIERAYRFLARAQSKGGAWSYSAPGGRSYDNSNTQFAALGIAAAERAGVKVDAELKKRAIKHWINCQSRDGGWGYVSTSSSTAMTCAGVASLSILGVKLEKRDKACGKYKYNKPLYNGLKWLTKAMRNRNNFGHASRKYYSLYALERVAIFMDIKDFGGVDWYRLGAEAILTDKRLPMLQVTDTALALLFLARGSAPIAIAKWRWEGDWNNQHSDVANWVKFSGEELKQRFDWVPARLDQLKSPAAKASLIFINGTSRFQPTDEEVEFLTAFLEAGGAVVAETSCSEKLFTKSFKKSLAEKLYPQLEPRWAPLSRQHPVLWIKHKLTLKDVPAVQFRAGCKRLNLIVLNRNISCPLNGDKDVQKDLQLAKKTATNLLAWALQNRKAERKLDDVRLEEPEERLLITRDQLRLKSAESTNKYRQPFSRLKHSGNWYAAPSFFPSLKALFEKRENFPKFDGEVFVSPLSKDVHQSAVIFITGYSDPMLSAKACLNLQTYAANGGFIFAINGCTSKDFDHGFRRAVRTMFPNDKLEAVPQTSSIYKKPFDLTKRAAKGTAAYAKVHGKKWAPLLGIRREGRWALIYSPIDMDSDISEGLHDSVIGYKRDSAAILTVNILYDGMKP